MDLKLDAFQVEILPYIYHGIHGGEERVYRITVTVNGERISRGMSTVSIPPQMTELEVLTRMVWGIREALEEKQKEIDEGKKK